MDHKGNQNTNQKAGRACDPIMQDLIDRLTSGGGLAISEKGHKEYEDHQNDETVDDADSDQQMAGDEYGEENGEHDQQNDGGETMIATVVM